MEDKEQEKERFSPTENFNPLDEDPQLYDVPTVQTSDHDADKSHSDDNTFGPDGDQGMNSLDGFLEDYCSAAASEIPFSPPANSRLAKREKIRRNSGKKQPSFRDYKASVAMDKQRKPKTIVSVIKERYTESNALLSGLHYNDSDVDLERDNAREGKEKRRKERDEKMKNITKSRQRETFMKRHSDEISAGNEYIGSNTAPMGIPTPVVPLKLEGSGRFLSLALGQSSKSLLLSPIASDRGERRQIAMAKSECPRDRQMFYKTFSALINMGSHGKKKDQKDKDSRMLAQRQHSSDEKLYMNCIWIGLQAWLNGVNPTEQERLMTVEREKIPAVLREVLEFKVQLAQSSLYIPGDQGIPLSRCSSEITNHSSSCSVDTCLTVSDITETYHSLTLSVEMIAQQQEAVIQVQKLLKKLDRCEQMFPTSSSFALEYTQYKDIKFLHRLETLYLWLNTTKDLCQKLNVLGQVLNISSVPDSSWPYVDFNCPRNSESFTDRDTSLHRHSIPEIVHDGVQGDKDEDVYDSDSGEEYKHGDTTSKNENGNDQKRVSFQYSEAKDQSQISLCSPLTSPIRGPSPNDFGNPTGASTPLKTPFSSTSLSRASSEASLDELARPSIYRTYVDKGLKKVGLNKMLIRLRDILYKSLRRARQSLEQPHADAESFAKSPTEELYHHSAVSPSLELLDNKSLGVPMESHTPAQLQAWREEFLEIGLPSYRPTYIFLLEVLLQVIHEAMKIRLEQLQNPIGEPSFLSIRQLIIECKDVLAKAVLVKQDYQCMVQAVLDDKEADVEGSPLDLELFDNDMSNMFKMYFQYLQNWLYHLQNLPEASRTLKNPLEEEWSFTKKICPHIIGGEAEAGKRFSTMAISLLNSISDFLESGVDECTTNLFDWTTNDISCSEEGEGDSDDDHDTSQPRRSKSTNSLRTSFQKTCRNFKNLFHEARERASKALGFAKLLRKDLEIAADFNVAVPTSELLHKLKESDHINVIAPLSAGYLMFIPARIAEHRRQIIQLLNVTCGREDVSVSSDLSNRDDGYLLMMRCGGGADSTLECPLWNGQSIQVEPTAETAIGLSHIQVESILLVVIHSSHLANQRREFEQLMGNTVELVNEQTSCHQVIAESLIELKESAISLRDKVATVIRQVEEHWNCDMEMEESEKNHILKLYRETMLQAYNFGFEYMKEVTRLVSGETRHKLGRGLMHFAKDWMKFVSEKCERGRGMRPRWANQGLDFLLIACEPKILAVLTEEEYKDLQESLNEFISHLIGNAETRQYGGPLPMRGSGSGTSDSYITHQQYGRYPSWSAPHADRKLPRSQSSKSVQDGPTSPHSAPASSYSALRILHSVPSLDSAEVPESSGTKKRASDSNLEVDLHDGEDGGIVMDVRRHRGSDSFLCSSHNVFSYNPHTRIVTAITKIEHERNKRLQDQRVIGHVAKHREVGYHINTRKVNFHWQKGNKIGEGQFGKVYSAVNMDTGELMAMKEMKFPSADMQYHFKEIIDEIKIFEGINHPNLVRYFGVEVHRTEMNVFMEYCDRGTIDEVSRVGLTEDLIRLYTKELLKAVQVLHDNGIVHRDIKGANIFLTSSGCLKLGDFGCSVKLKNHTTMVGEVNSLVGTTAYMAPEVITRNDKEGHGRAADIWSVGCVVIEMVSGKRPWHELESNYQIMFKLGMGETPPTPENLGDEGKDFLTHCFEQEPDKRWTASQLRDHPFAKIYDPEGDAEDADNSHHAV